jgi:hypothetical protein
MRTESMQVAAEHGAVELGEDLAEPGLADTGGAN